jgi:hypothetical protein
MSEITVKQLVEAWKCLLGCYPLKDQMIVPIFTEYGLSSRAVPSDEAMFTEVEFRRHKVIQEPRMISDVATTCPVGDAWQVCNKRIGDLKIAGEFFTILEDDGCPGIALIDRGKSWVMVINLSKLNC